MTLKIKSLQSLETSGKTCPKFQKTGISTSVKNVIIYGTKFHKNPMRNFRVGISFMEQ